MLRVPLSTKPKNAISNTKIKVMNFNSVEELKENGFAGFKSIKELAANYKVIPKKKGVYVVLFQFENRAKFLPIGSGPALYKNAINPNVSVKELEDNWVENTIVINIGKAGGLNKHGIEQKSTLRSRLKAYLKFGQGKDVRHYGGRFIWQIENSKDLVICWKELTELQPRDFERALIREFIELYKRKPFANLQL